MSEECGQPTENGILEIPNTCQVIGDSAFYINPFNNNNNALTEVNISNTVTSIGVRAFANNQIESVSIPDSVTSIGEQAFYNNLLTSVTIPDSVTSIGEDAFSQNPLQKVYYPNDTIKELLLNSLLNSGLDENILELKIPQRKPPPTHEKPKFPLWAWILIAIGIIVLLGVVIFLYVFYR